MKRLVADNHADVRMIGAVVGILITLIISILLIYTMSGSMDFSTVDEKVAEARGYTDGPTVGDDDNSSWTNFNASSDVTNSSTDILDSAATFFQIAPIIAIVVVAVVILGYVGKIGGT